MALTTTDLNKFAAAIRRSYRTNSEQEVRVDNVKRGYCLIWNVWNDSRAETANEEATQAVALALDGVDAVYAL